MKSEDIKVIEQFQGTESDRVEAIKAYLTDYVLKQLTTEERDNGFNRDKNV